MSSPKYPNVDRFLRVVLAVAEEGQITRAAIRLGTAQPWVSRQIREVEEEVGVKLFKRIHSGVEATPSGAAFLDEARQAVLHGELSVARARAASASVLDQLLIGVSPAFGPDTYERIQQCLRSVLPGIRLSFDSRFVSEQVESLLRTDLHAGLAELPVHSDRIQALLLKREPMVLAGGRGEPLLAASSLQAGGLNRKPFVILETRRHPSQQRLAESLCKWGVRADNIREVLTLPEALQQVAVGKSIGILPPLAIKLHYEDVVFRPLKSFQIGYGVIYHEDHRSPAIKALLSALKGSFATDRTAMKSKKMVGPT
ncbi:MAG: LysR family transcriptional regulator [Acidobacteriaceae bacterium]